MARSPVCRISWVVWVGALACTRSYCTLPAVGVCERSAGLHVAGTRARLPIAYAPEQFEVVDTSLPVVIFEDAQIFIVAKPVGMPVGEGRPAKSRDRLTLLCWLRGAAPLATFDGSDLVAVTPLRGAVGGLVVVAKTPEAAACLQACESATACEYMAVLSGAPGDHHDTSCGRLGLEWLETSIATPTRGRGFVHARSLSLVSIATDAAIDSSSVCDEFGAKRLVVVGSREVVAGQKVRAKREVRRAAEVAKTTGGIHLALVGLVLPPALAALRSPGTATSFRIAPPRKFAKTMKRELLEAGRLASKESALAAKKAAKHMELATKGSVGAVNESWPVIAHTRE